VGQVFATSTATAILYFDSVSTSLKDVSRNHFARMFTPSLYLGEYPVVYCPNHAFSFCDFFFCFRRLAAFVFGFGL
jgi:hypothetical protein